MNAAPAACSHSPSPSLCAVLYSSDQAQRHSLTACPESEPEVFRSADVFKSALLCVVLPSAVLSTLSGCLGPMVAGYPNGTEKEPIETMAIKPAIAARPAQQLLVQQTYYTARILASPDGGRAKVPMFSTYRYYLKTGDAPALELGFLHVSNDMIGRRQWLEKAFPVPNSDEWVGLKSDYPDDIKHLEEAELRRKYRFPPRQYTVVVFNAERIVRQYVFVCVQNEFQFLSSGSSPSFRMLRDDGWWLIDLVTGRIAPEPNRPREARPDNHYITIPGAGWRIAINAPSFTFTKETLTERYYLVEAHTSGSSGDHSWLNWNDPPGDGIAIKIQVELNAQEGLTREELISGWFKPDPPPALHHGVDYDRCEFVASDGSLKQIDYFAVVHGRSVVVRLRFRPPFEKWTDAIARFDAALRFEDSPREAAAEQNAPK